MCAVCVLSLSAISRSDIHFLARWWHQFVVLQGRASCAGNLHTFFGPLLLLFAA